MLYLLQSTYCLVIVVDYKMSYIVKDVFKKIYRKWQSEHKYAACMWHHRGSKAMVGQLLLGSASKVKFSDWIHFLMLDLLLYPQTTLSMLYTLPFSAVQHLYEHLQKE